MYWNPISEALPGFDQIKSDGDQRQASKLVFAQILSEIRLARYHYGTRHWVDESTNVVLTTVTHWMPLPFFWATEDSALPPVEEGTEDALGFAGSIKVLVKTNKDEFCMARYRFYDMSWEFYHHDLIYGNVTGWAHLPKMMPLNETTR